MLILNSFKQHNQEFIKERPSSVLSEFIKHLTTGFLLSEAFPSGAGNVSQEARKGLKCEFESSHSEVLDKISREMFGLLFPDKKKDVATFSMKDIQKAIKQRIKVNSSDSRELELDKQIRLLRDDNVIKEGDENKIQQGIFSAFSKFIPEYEQNHQLIVELEHDLEKDPNNTEIKNKLEAANETQKTFLEKTVKKEILEKSKESVSIFRKFMHNRTKEIKDEFDDRRVKIIDALSDQTDFKGKLEKLFTSTIDSKINKRIVRYFSRLPESIDQFKKQNNTPYFIKRLLTIPSEVAKPIAEKTEKFPFVGDFLAGINDSQLKKFLEQISELKYLEKNNSKQEGLTKEIIKIVGSGEFKKELTQLLNTDFFTAVKNPKKNFTSKKNQALKLLESLSEEKKKQKITFMTRKGGREETMTLETAILNFPFVFSTVPENNTLDLMGENGKTKLSSGEGVTTLGISLLPFASAALGVNLCPYSTGECEASCLGHTAGGAIQYADAAFLSKLLRTYFAFTHPKDFAYVIARDVYLNEEWAKQANKTIESEYTKIQNNPDYKPTKKSALALFHEEDGKLVPNFTSIKSGIRFNVTSDIPYHEILPPIFFDMFVDTQFYDYTKNHTRIPTLQRSHKQGKLKNYYLSLSHTGSFEEETGKNYSNDRAVIHTLKTGGVVSSVFGAHKTKKAKLNEENLTNLFNLFDISENDRKKLSELENDDQYKRIEEFDKINKRLKLEGKKIGSFTWVGTANKSGIKNTTDLDKTGEELFKKYFADYYLDDYIFPKFAVVYNSASDKDPYLFPCVNGDKDDNVYDRHKTVGIKKNQKVFVDEEEITIGVVSALKFKGHEKEAAGRFMNPLQQMELPIPYQISQKELLDNVYGRRISQIVNPSSLNTFPVLVIGKHLKN